MCCQLSCDVADRRDTVMVIVCKHALVFCPGKQKQGPWTEFELEWFLTHRSPDDVFLVVTHGAAPWEVSEEFFTERVIRSELHQKIWYDLRGFYRREGREWQKVRDFDDERTRLAADLNAVSAGVVQPIWHRQQR